MDAAGIMALRLQAERWSLPKANSRAQNRHGWRFWAAQGIEAEQKTVRFFVGAESPVWPEGPDAPKFLKKSFVLGRRFFSIPSIVYLRIRLYI
jgi:hypothetical protein